MPKSEVYEGFIGETYRALSGNVSADRCVNWYPEVVPTGVGKSKINYYPTPGLMIVQNATHGNLGQGRGLFALNGRRFAVIGPSFVELTGVFPTTHKIVWGTVEDDGMPVSFASNGTQIAIASAGKGYLYDLGNVFGQISGGVDLNLDPSGQTPGQFFGAAQFAFMDGYLIALMPNSRQIQISYLGDGWTWSALDIGLNLGSPDNLVAITVDHEYLYLFGNARSTVWNNTGAGGFPLAPVSGAFVEQGCAAAASVVRDGTTLIWLGRDERGGGVLYRASGFIPERISTHAVEQAWQQYGTMADAVAFLAQRNGHMEYRITFPTADASWCLDLTTNMWHERASFNPKTGQMHAQIQRFHCYADGFHYVTGTDGVIYSEAQGVYSDAALPIRRLRVAPVIAAENVRMFFPRLEIDVQPGVGLDGAAAPGTEPTMMLRYSDDGGRTFYNEITTTIGAIGETETRACFDALGSGMRRVFEISVTDPVNWVLIGAWLPGLEAGTH